MGSTGVVPSGNSRFVAASTVTEKRPPAPVVEHAWASLLVCLLLVISTITWRGGVYFSGGLDPVVVAKAVVSMLALLLALAIRAQVKQTYPLRVYSLGLLGSYVAVGTLGAIAAGSPVASTVLGIRLCMLAVTVYLLLRCFPSIRVLRDLMIAMMAVGGIAVLTGLPAVLSGERLRGVFPPLHPNEIALLAAVPMLGIIWRCLHRRGNAWLLMMAGALLGVLWLTGSRTSLVAALAALVLMLVLSRPIRAAAAIVVVLCIPLMFYLAFFTATLAGFLERGGAENVVTLNARTIAWSAALSFPETDWARWLGSGLAQRKIPVEGQYWDVQGLDSSWVSALVQTGLIGLAIAVLWAVLVTIGALRAPSDTSSLLAPIALFLLVRSVLESGLLESSVAFCTWMMVSIICERQIRPRNMSYSEVYRGS